MMRRKAQAGFTLLEMAMVAIIVSLLAALLIPMLSKVKYNAQIMQCQNNLKELGAALALYQNFQGRIYQSYPDRLTHLYDLDYVTDQRLFVCPADSTKAVGHSNLQQNVLKPGNPSDTKWTWAERSNSPYANYDGDPRQRNCSYLYEFSTRICQDYDIPTDTWNEDYSDWAENFLLHWEDDGNGTGTNDRYNDIVAGIEPDANFPMSLTTSPSPTEMSRFQLLDPSDPTGSTGLITWQEAKFWQLQHGDICNSCLAQPGDGDAYPTGWFQNSVTPYDAYYTNGTDNPQSSYKDSWLPIVRCFWHQTPALIDNEAYLGVLNLAVGGNTFMSAPGWEQSAWLLGRDSGTDWQE